MIHHSKHFYKNKQNIYFKILEQIINLINDLRIK